MTDAPTRCPTCESEDRNRLLDPCYAREDDYDPWHDAPATANAATIDSGEVARGVREAMSPAPADLPTGDPGPPCTCDTSDRCAQHTVAGREAWAHGVLTEVAALTARIAELEALVRDVPGPGDHNQRNWNAWYDRRRTLEGDSPR